MKTGKFPDLVYKQNVQARPEKWSILNMYHNIDLLNFNLMNSTILQFRAVIFTVLICLLTSTFSFAQENKELIIVTFGNSTTAPRKGIEKVYAVRIHDALAEAGIPNKVINSGIGGSHTGSIKDSQIPKIEHGMDRFNKAVLAHHPDWVTLNFGLNDAYQDQGEGTSSRIPLENYISNLTYFIAEIKKNNGKVILLTPNPLSSKLKHFHHERLKLYRDAVIKLAKAQDVELINSWKLFGTYAKKNPGGMEALLPDGTHPMDTGHELIAREIVKIIKKKNR